MWATPNLNEAQVRQRSRIGITFLVLLLLFPFGCGIAQIRGGTVRPNQGLVRTAEETGLALSALADDIPQGQTPWVPHTPAPGETRRGPLREFVPGEPNPPSIQTRFQMLAPFFRFFNRTHDIRWIHTIHLDPIGIEQQLDDPPHQIALNLQTEMTALAPELGWTERERWEGDGHPNCGMEPPFPTRHLCSLEAVSFSREDRFGTWGLSIDAHCGGQLDLCHLTIRITSPTVRR